MLYAAQLEAEVRSGEIEATRAATRRLEANFAAELTAGETHWQAAVDQLHVIPSIPSFPTPLESLSRYDCKLHSRARRLPACTPLAPPLQLLALGGGVLQREASARESELHAELARQSETKPAELPRLRSRYCLGVRAARYVCLLTHPGPHAVCVGQRVRTCEPTPIVTGQRCARSVGRRARASRAGACPPWRSALPSGRALRVGDCRREAERARTDERTALLLGAAAEREGQLAAELRARTQAAAALEAELARQPHRPALDDLEVRNSPSKHTAARARAHSRARTHTRAHTW
jgi:hypothetical protein